MYKEKYEKYKKKYLKLKQKGGNDIKWMRGTNSSIFMSCFKINGFQLVLPNN